MSKFEIYEDTPYYPAGVALEVTLRCNMFCMHCGSGATKKPRPKEISLDQWKDVVDQLADLGTEYFTLSGGEPFVYEHWRELCKHISTKSQTLAIISNGYAITPDDVEYLNDTGMYNIGLSLDGLAGTHDKIRGVPGAYEHIINIIKHFKKTKIKAAVVTTVNQMNFNELPTIQKVLEDLGVDLWQTQPICYFGRAGKLKDSLSLSIEQYGQLVEFICDAQKRFNSGEKKMRIMPSDAVGYCHGIASTIWEDCEWGGCNAGKYVIGIRSNGDVTGCLSLQEDEFIEGNINSRKIADIWNDSKTFAYTRHFKVENLSGACLGCDKGDICRGGCTAMARSASGKTHNNPYCYKHYMQKGK